MNHTVLIIDDNPSNLQVLSECLSRAGIEVLTARSGESGLEKARFVQPDLILLDVILPGIDGFETCVRLKSDESTRDIPVIFSTVLTDTEHKLRGFEVGAVDYVTKPFYETEVLARVKTHLHLQELTHSLEAKIHELESFAYIVSHDLKAPLRGINHVANWLIEDYPERFNANGQELCDLLITRVQHMNRLIDGVLQYSRAGHSEKYDDVVDTHALINDLIKVLEPPRAIRITIDQPLPLVKGDFVRIGQIFQNLLSNAMTFTQRPDGHVRIGCVDGGTYWQFSVSDNGVGIEPGDHNRIFQIFQTSGTHGSRESSGVGLTVVKKIVESHGGRIWVNSTPGEGSTFTFTLPKTAERHARQNDTGQPG